MHNHGKSDVLCVRCIGVGLSSRVTCRMLSTICAVLHDFDSFTADCLLFAMLDVTMHRNEQVYANFAVIYRTCDEKFNDCLVQLQHVLS
jgi:hypothetical protein